MIKEMSKLQLLGPKSLLDESIKVLHTLGVLHIEEIPHTEDPTLKRLPIEKEKAEERDSLEDSRELLKSLLLLLKGGDGGPAHLHGKVDPDLICEVPAIIEEAKETHQKIESLTEELKGIEKYEKLLKSFAPVLSRLGGLRNFEIMGLTLDSTKKDVGRLLEEEVERITEGRYEFIMRSLDDDTLGIVVSYPKSFDKDLRYLISGEAINEVRLPEAYENVSFVDALKGMARRRLEIPGDIILLEDRLERISKEWYPIAEGLLRRIDDGLDEIGVIKYCRQTKFTFLIEGWVPKDLVEDLKSKFREVYGERILIRELQVREEERDLVPVFIKNSRLLKPFEVFLLAMPAPKYGSVDPTIFVALFFPVFFGLIVGDIGYGLIIGGLGIFLKRLVRKKNLGETFYDMATIMVICSASAILFGIFFGELFGDLGERYHILHPIIFDRARALSTFMVLAVGVGIGHVLLGFIIGLVNSLSKGHVKKAVLKVVNIMLLLTFLIIMGVLFNLLPSGILTPGLVVLLSLMVILIILEGIVGPLEFLETLGNILSYIRLMAVGTASVSLAIVANEVGGMTGNIFAGIIVAGLLHTINIILSILSPTIQSARLQYVEFFSKFYEGGGRRYEPFRKR